MKIGGVRVTGRDYLNWAMIAGIGLVSTLGITYLDNKAEQEHKKQLYKKIERVQNYDHLPSTTSSQYLKDNLVQKLDSLYKAENPDSDLVKKLNDSLSVVQDSLDKGSNFIRN